MGADRRARIVAGLLAAAGWIGLALMLWRQATAPGWTLAWALYWNSMFFSDLGNLATAIVLTGVALRVAPLSTPRMLGLALLSMLLIGGMYHGLSGFRAFTMFGTLPPGDILIHSVTPFGTLFFWLLLAPHGGTRWRDLILWVGFPLLYFGYALARGAATADYPYPWMNPDGQGYGPPLAFAGTVAAVFLLLGALVVPLDHWLGRRRGPSPAAPA